MLVILDVPITYIPTTCGRIDLQMELESKNGTKRHFEYLPNQLEMTKMRDTDFKKNRGYQFNNTINELAVGLEYNFYEYDISSPEKIATPYILLNWLHFNYKSVADIAANGKSFIPIKPPMQFHLVLDTNQNLSDAFAFAIEAKVRYTFEDDLDYTTGRFPSLDFGGNGNDWYAFTGISIVYTFGRPACYTKGL